LTARISATEVRNRLRAKARTAAARSLGARLFHGKYLEEIQVAHPATRLQPYSMKKHDATRLHYDLRLGWNGVLKSFAIPFGPSDRAGDRREAIQVEDHRREYLGFEGVIEEGKYGAGTVMLWDIGMWEPLPEYADVDAGLRNGRLMFTLHGEKLKGAWSLIRRGPGLQNQRNPIWDLVKEPDSFARGDRRGSILEEAPDSVSTGRSLEEINRYWHTGKRKPESDTLFEM
jgi:bifunctional non-homologous end joining protein LigD